MLKKNFFRLLLTLVLVTFTVQGTLADTKWHWDKGTIVVDTPERPAGQKNVLNLQTPALPVVRVAFVGLGMRGPGAVSRWTHINGVRIVALCDYEKDRAEKCQNILKKAGLPEAAIYSGPDGYKELCKREDINLVYIATDWKNHVPVAKCALENGKHAAIEVPSATNLQECWDLINLAEQKQLHCMLLENCCYDFFEMNTLNMAQNGVFGEVIRCQGAYLHTLSEYWADYWHNWRLDFNKEVRGDVYATHGLGPVAQVMNIHRGDRMKTLVAMDTRPFTGPGCVKKYTGKDCPEEEFRNGDHTTTLIRTEQGKVIEIQHDVMNPQPYNRLYQLIGTKGYANKYPQEGYAVSTEQLKSVGVTPKAGNMTGHEYMSAEDRALLDAKFQAPILKKYGEVAKKVGGHGGMDFTMDCRLVYCLQNGLPLDIDVYDLAEWCCLAELGALSMDNNCASVQVPDFTRGFWNVQNGYKHAYATPEKEAESAAIAKAYTTVLKEKGADAAEKELKKLLKAQAKKK